MPTEHVIERFYVGAWSDENLGRIDMWGHVRRTSGRGVYSDRVRYFVSYNDQALAIGDVEAMAIKAGDARARREVGFALFLRFREPTP